jgi:hypothetical protein
VAELLVSTGYRDAVNAGFEQSPDKYMIQQTAAQAVIFEAFNQKGAMAERIWETRRMAALTEATGTDLGLFGDYIHSQGGKSKPAALTIADLPAGEPEVVKTNAAINGLNRVYSEPIDFLESALEFTTQRRQAGKGKVGPENYATMLKFFADKVQTFPSTHLDPVLTSTLANRAMDGFVDIAKVDKPNFVEMTNVYVAVRTLPPGAFAPRQSGPVIAHSLEQLLTRPH